MGNEARAGEYHGALFGEVGSLGAGQRHTVLMRAAHPKSDRTYGLSLDPAGNVVLTGLTFSSNFPLENPAQTYPGNTGNQNAFVTKFSFHPWW